MRSRHAGERPEYGRKFWRVNSGRPHTATARVCYTARTTATVDNASGRPNTRRHSNQGIELNQAFIKGIDLSRLFYQEAVRPILENHFPGLTYSAALIGSGSEVLGLDTPQSIDHDWGPRLQLFMIEVDFATLRDQIDQLLRHELPLEVCGFPTNFGRHEHGTAVMTPIDRGPVDHGAETHTVRGFFERALGFDPAGAIRPADWLSVPENQLRLLTAGAVYHDGLRALEPLREKLRYYPREIWLYLLAAQWARIGQEEAFAGRCVQVGDELGSRLVAARLVRDVVRLCFLMERTYAPFIKWLGTAFAQLECAGDMLPLLLGALAACNWEERQAHLSAALESAACMHNALNITPHLEARVSNFHNRPFLVIHASRFVEAIRSEILDPEVLALPANVGSVDQFIDSTDALRYLDRLKAVCERWGDHHPYDPRDRSRDGERDE